MAPTFRHGRGTVIFADEYELTRVTRSADAEASVEVADTSVYADDDKTYLPGLVDASVTYGGLFDGNLTTGSGVPVGMQAVIEDALGSTAVVQNTYGPEGSAVGRHARLFEGIPDSLKFSAPLTDVVSWEASQAMGSPMAAGVMLVDAATALTGPSTHTSVNTGTTSTSGGAIHAHVLEWTSTGTWTWRVQHSSAGVAWADLSTARSLTAATRYQRVEVTGTVKAYLKAVISAVSTGSAPKLAVAAGRYHA